MVHGFTYGSRRLKLALEKARCERRYTRGIKKLSKDGEAEVDIEREQGEGFSERQFIEEEISALMTDQLVTKARRLIIPTPRQNEAGMWEKCTSLQRYVLTTKGLNRLRSDVRKEVRDRVQLVALIASVITGLIGAMTGLIAVALR